MRVALATDLDKIIDTLKAQALAGDAQAIRIILDRVLPALRPVDIPTVLALPADGWLQLEKWQPTSRTRCETRSLPSP
jgi:hypothetical protein